MEYVDKSVADLRTMGGQSKDLANPRRDALLAKFVNRCKGFSKWDQKLMFDAARSLLQRAQDAGYPPAIAHYLPICFTPETRQQSDATAKQLLSGEIDGDVVQGVYDYLARRSGVQPPKQLGDPDVVAAAWQLLACNYGADCGENNGLVVSLCLYRASCDDNLESALPHKYPSLTPERMAEAARMTSVIASQIQSRDFGHLGFD
jgi:hypothetical protein